MPRFPEFRAYCLFFILIRLGVMEKIKNRKKIRHSPDLRKRGVGNHRGGIDNHPPHSFCAIM